MIAALLLQIACLSGDTLVVNRDKTGQLCVPKPAVVVPPVIPPITPPVVLPGGSNEPLGFTRLAENDFHCTVTNCVPGWVVYDSSYKNWVTVNQDPNAPKSPSPTVSMIFRQGLAGTSPGTFATNLTPKASLYTALWFNVSEAFVGNPSGVNKVLHWFINRQSAGNIAILNLRGSGAAPLVPGFLLQGLGMSMTYQGNTSTEQNLDPLPSVCTFTRGVWHKVETVITGNTPGVRNGRAQLWMDGKVCIDVSGIGWAASGQSNLWNNVWYSPTWGGAGGSIPVPFSMTADHVYLSGK